MRFAAISDIHGNLPALEAVAADIARQGIAQVVNLGDILSGPLLPAETADWLMTRGFTTIAGNHERQLLREMQRPAHEIDPGTSDGYAALQIGEQHAAWLRTLPPTHWLSPEVLLVHGTPGSDLVYWLDTVTPDFGQHGSTGMRAASAEEVTQRLQDGDPAARRASLALCGHTHVPRIVRSGETLVVNPGSVGLQAYDDGRPHYHLAANGTPHARYAVLERGAAGWTARLCAVPYDWDAMSRLAARNGRADWAYALATGRMPAPPATIPP